MKKLKSLLYLENDTDVIFGKLVNLNSTTAGHYAVPFGDPFEDEEVMITSVRDQTYTEKIKRVVKLHKQFAHPKKEPFTLLLKDADAYDDEVKEI